MLSGPIEETGRRVNKDALRLHCLVKMVPLCGFVNQHGNHQSTNQRESKFQHPLILPLAPKPSREVFGIHFRNHVERLGDSRKCHICDFLSVR
jgi:hypothetical protein